ncbi:hypothetical protein BUALT_Bualt05G0023500 [Buddleja alternifolia]|uniref:Uncharacterized protein n=1 Tax=Buddleja alternifolia TaxID=168488 RepID=A0AAV6XFS5_9LAMI|nr:hypothetical protein BUALT_Bualt05G0023500 [Buddleja alternifolia]
MYRTNQGQGLFIDEKSKRVLETYTRLKENHTQSSGSASAIPSNNCSQPEIEQQQLKEEMQEMKRERQYCTLAPAGQYPPPAPVGQYPPPAPAGQYPPPAPVG